MIIKVLKQVDLEVDFRERKWQTSTAEGFHLHSSKFVDLKGVLRDVGQIQTLEPEKRQFFHEWRKQELKLGVPDRYWIATAHKIAGCLLQREP